MTIKLTKMIFPGICVRLIIIFVSFIVSLRLITVRYHQFITLNSFDGPCIVADDLVAILFLTNRSFIENQTNETLKVCYEIL